jgi:hypothetical protein
VLVTAHDAFGYFGRANGLTVRGIQGLSTDSEASLRELNALIDLIVERKVPAVFVESSVPRKAVEALVEGCGARGHAVTIGGELLSDAIGPAGTEQGTHVGMVVHDAELIARSLGGTVTSDPSCVAAGGRLDCVVRGSDDALYVRTLAGGAWSGWRRMGGRMSSAPDCVADAQGATQCFARGADAALWQVPVEAGAGGPRSLGGWIHGEASCATQADGLMQCFARGSDDALWRNAFDGVRWSGWRQERASGGLVQAPPRCVASSERNGVDCFVVTNDGTLRHRVRDGGGPDEGAWPWTVAATGLMPEAPGCIAQRGSVSCAARGVDRRVLHAGWTVD